MQIHALSYITTVRMHLMLACLEKAAELAGVGVGMFGTSLRTKSSKSAVTISLFGN